MRRFLPAIFTLMIFQLKGQISIVKDIAPGVTASAPSNFFEFNGTLIFRANDAVNGIELWKTDGTEAGTKLVKNIADGNANSNPSGFTTLGSNFYFNATTGTTVTGQELYKSNGTEAGTGLVKDIRTGTGSSNPQNLVNFTDKRLFFAANDGVTGVELFETDGTDVGTKLVKDYTGTAGSISEIKMMKGIAYILQIADKGRELYKSDGTEAGSTIVKDINPGTGVGVNTELFVSSNNTLYFAGNSGTTGTELWKSDGTEAGTVLVKEIFPGTDNGNPRRFVELNNKIYFNANSASGVELWVTDGTEAGTTIVKDINPAGNSNPDRIISANGAVYFFAQEDGTLYDFYKFDGTNVTKLAEVNAAANTVNTNYAVFDKSIVLSIGGKLWVTDGTTAGTASVASKIAGSPDPASILNITKLGNLVYFAGTLDAGSELYKFNPAILTNTKNPTVQSVTVFPNPAQGVVEVEGKFSSEATYTLTNITGQKLISGRLDSRYIKLDQSTEIQLLTILDNNQIYTQKIINKL